MNHDLFIFGSVVRGEVSSTSDTDILVIPAGPVARNAYPSHWSVYQRETLRDYFSEGRLFAWHLHLESRCVYSAGPMNWLQILGDPAPYSSAREDVLTLTTLLDESLAELQHDTNSAIYELGICYTAVRDIAMSASWQKIGAPCFSRYAPYKLPIPVPLDRESYECAMVARHYSTRGDQRPAAVSATVSALLAAPLIDWARTLGDSL